ncbi:Protein NEDD1 [Lamellibrachia satsuma]|nr:Protein NEDD1 [Lamellibrachia satsuma]
MKLVSVGDDIKLWDCTSFTRVKQFNPHAHNVSSVCWSHDNSALASASSGGDKIVLTYSDATAYSKDIAVGEGRTCVSFNSTSRFLIGGGPDGIIHIWDLKTMKLKKSYKDHKGPLTSLQFNCDDTVIASASETGDVILYNIISGQSCSPLVTQKGQAVRQVQYSHFRKSLLGSVCDSGTVSLWDTNRNTLTHAFITPHSAPATGLAFSLINDMLLMSVGLDKKIVCYDVHGKDVVQTMVAESPLTSVSMMHDGTTLAVGSIRGKVYIYDLRKGSTPLKVIAAHKSSVKCMSFEAARNKARSSSIGRGGKEPKTNTRKSNTGGSTSGNHATLPQSSSQKPTNGSTSESHEAIRNSHSANIDKSYLSTTLNDGTNVSGRRDTWDHMEMFSPLRERVLTKNFRNKKVTKVDGSASMLSGNHSYLDNTDTSVGVSSMGVTSGQSANQYTDGIYSPVGDHVRSRGRLTDTASDSSGVSPALDTRPIPAGLSLDDIHIGGDNGHIGAAGDVGPGGNSGSPGGYIGSPGDYSGTPGGQSQYSGYGSTIPAERTCVDVLPNRQSPRGVPPQPQWSFSQGHGSSVNHDVAVASASALDLPVAAADTRVTQSKSEGDFPRGLRPHNAWTPTDAQPSVGGDGSGAIGLPPQSFPTQFVKNIIEDALDDFREQIRRDILDVHTSMLKQFLLQQTEINSMLQQYSLNTELLEEINRLREENSRLKKNY